MAFVVEQTNLERAWHHVIRGSALPSVGQISLLRPTDGRADPRIPWCQARSRFVCSTTNAISRRSPWVVRDYTKSGTILRLARLGVLDLHWVVSVEALVLRVAGRSVAIRVGITIKSRFPGIDLAEKQNGITRLNV